MNYIARYILSLYTWMDTHNHDKEKDILERNAWLNTNKKYNMNYNQSNECDYLNVKYKLKKTRFI